MTESDRRLLIVDLSARLPYKPKVQFNLRYGDNGHKEGLYPAMISSIDPTGWIEVDYEEGNSVREWSCTVEDIKPYLRHISDMTNEEIELLGLLGFSHWTTMINNDRRFQGPMSLLDAIIRHEKMVELIDFLNSIHVDYRGLIEKGLALKAVEGMYI